MEQLVMLCFALLIAGCIDTLIDLIVKHGFDAALVDKAALHVLQVFAQPSPKVAFRG